MARAKKRGSKKERKLTRKEAEARISKAIGEILSDSGLKKPEDIQEQVRAIFTGSSQQSVEVAFSPLLAHFAYEIVELELKRCKMRAFTEKQLEALLGEVKSKAKEAPSIIRKGLGVIRKNLPRRGGPGRRAVLSPAERIEACEQVATMFKTKKMSLPDIFEAVAEGFRARGIQVAARTIKRTWEKRTELYT